MGQIKEEIQKINRLVLQLKNQAILSLKFCAFLLYYHFSLRPTTSQNRLKIIGMADYCPKHRLSNLRHFKINIKDIKILAKKKLIFNRIQRNLSHF